MSTGRGGRALRGESPALLPDGAVEWLSATAHACLRWALALVGLCLAVILLSFHPDDPSWHTVPGSPDAIPNNLFGVWGANIADSAFQFLGIAAFVPIAVLLAIAAALPRLAGRVRPFRRLLLTVLGTLACATAAAPFATPDAWQLATGLGGTVGQVALERLAGLSIMGYGPLAPGLVALAALALAVGLIVLAIGLSPGEWLGAARRGALVTAHIASLGVIAARQVGSAVNDHRRRARARPRRSAEDAPPFRSAREAVRPDGFDGPLLPESLAESLPESLADSPEDPFDALPEEYDAPSARSRAEEVRRHTAGTRLAAKGAKIRKPKPRNAEAAPPQLPLSAGAYQMPPLSLLQAPEDDQAFETVDTEALRQNADMLQTVLADFGVRGDVVRVNPGPVVTLYELEPAAGTKSSRVINLADDIARSMSAISTRVAVVPGRNVIGIELPNTRRQTVWLRALLASKGARRSKGKLDLFLGKDIGGEPILADLAAMPHLLVAGTTGSGKSVAVNAMILSLLYRLPPEKVRFIMIDPKMLELSAYDGIPHLLSPVVTDPKRAVVALKWTVREMENRYRSMSTLGVRNIEGYNQRVSEARARGEALSRRVQTGYDSETGKPVYEEQALDLTELPYIVVVVDEMADLMLVAGKDIEAAIQRLAQMARAAGIHIVMATQRPSVDVITGTIKANFPTRISFQVTSKVDSRTILGESGAEQLLGQGDMLYMAGGGRIKRLHGPFVSDDEVEAVVAHLKDQGEPNYDHSITEEEGGENAIFDALSLGGGDGEDAALYDKAVALVAREKKASTSFIQRHLKIGYNRAARIIEEMESQGVVSPANHVGKREVLVGDHGG